ncbi:MAG TPA: hypothetical protein VK451_08950 [Methyloceanibacter sp.]|nr:hypothetical protein [Methyloceanibacter sp.]
MKSRIIEQLGQAELILPNLVAGALRANERAKLRMSVLQAAVQHAHDPHSAPPDLAPECGSAGIDAIATRGLIAGARDNGGGVIEAPGLAKLNEALLADVATMIKAVGAGDTAAGISAEQRFKAIAAAALDLGTERMTEGGIAKLTAIGETDSLHRLVMDLHKALNRMTAQCAEESVAGALTYGLHPEDKPLVTAFMRGLERTRGLKFDHPGLDTTAVRGETRLMIQNDIGTTDAHVLVVSVEDLSVTVTHSDVHAPRAKFFVELFDRFKVGWSRLHQTSAEGLAEGEAFYLVTGRYQAETEDAMCAFLEAVGAVLVFLIDWNKARKALRKLIGNGDAIQVLDWAARHEVGHRAFLELGGEELIASAVRRAAPARLGFGEELADLLGREATLKFVKTALRLSTEALRQGRSARSVREMLEVDLVRRIERNDSALLTIVVRQLGLARDVATRIASAIGDGHVRQMEAARYADRARRIEEKADAIAVDARQAVARTEAAPTIAALIDAAENAIDELEQAAFLVSLLPVETEPSLLAPLAELSAAAISGTEAAVRGLEAAASLAEGEGGSAENEDALQATARLGDLEHAADASERAVARLVLRGGASREGGLVALELARALERSSDRLSLIGHVLHTHVMGELSK